LNKIVDYTKELNFTPQPLNVYLYPNKAIARPAILGFWLCLFAARANVRISYVRSYQRQHSGRRLLALSVGMGAMRLGRYLPSVYPPIHLA